MKNKIGWKSRIKFEVGSKYYCRSVGDADCRWEYTVVKRTEKTVTIDHPTFEKPKRKKIDVWQGCETIRPEGNYSMAPILGADKKCEPFDEDADPVVRALKAKVKEEFGKLSDKVEIITMKEEEK